MTALSSTRVLVGRELVPADVVTADGRVTEVAPHGSVPWSTDLGDLVLAPGLVDVQVNGGFGHDITSHPASLWEVAASLPRQGVTAFCPTVITGPVGTIDRALGAIGARPPGFVGAEPLGLHVEGPYISAERRGAHPLAHVGTFVDPAPWAPPAVRIVTLAPEVTEMDLVAELARRGVVVALGHTDARHDVAVAAIGSGARHVTHVFNAMRPFDHRRPGVVGAALVDGRVTIGLIADGIHLHPTTLALVARAVGVDRLVATTDAMAAAGMSPGAYWLGDHEVLTDGVRARLADGTLAGSVLTMAESVGRLARFARLDLAASLLAHTANPARVLGEVGRGEIRVGARADLVVLDDDGGVHLTMVGGQVVHEG
ncbi:MAG: N-acetylglucosamine-6-phosphate deacetylase [Acidimicrobiia bacterium]